VPVFMTGTVFLGAFCSARAGVSAKRIAAAAKELVSAQVRDNTRVKTSSAGDTYGTG